jgi:hypothetical protein
VVDGPGMVLLFGCSLGHLRQCSRRGSAGKPGGLLLFLGLFPRGQIATSRQNTLHGQN